MTVSGTKALAAVTDNVKSIASFSEDAFNAGSATCLAISFNFVDMSFMASFKDEKIGSVGVAGSVGVI